MFRVNWNPQFYFELVVIVWFVLMNVSCDGDIIGRVYEVVMEHSLISVVNGFGMKKCIQTLLRPCG